MSAADRLPYLSEDQLGFDFLVRFRGVVLSEIVTGIGRVSEIVSTIAACGKEQSTGLELVNGLVAEVGTITHQNAASSEESSAAADELAGQAEELAAMVDAFQISRHGASASASRATIGHRTAAQFKRHSGAVAPENAFEAVPPAPSTRLTGRSDGDRMTRRPIQYCPLQMGVR